MNFEQNLQSTSGDRQASEMTQYDPRPKSKSQYFYLLLGIGGLGLVLLLVRPLLLTSAREQPEESARVLPVETIVAEPVTSYQVSRTYTGEVAAARASNLGFFRGGEIDRVLVREGDRVTKGQKLAQLDRRSLQTQRQQLVAEQARAQAQLTELQTGARLENINAASAAVRDLEQQLKLQAKQKSRREFLYTQGAIAREELDEFAFGEEALQARLSQARSNLAELENGTRREQIAAQKATLQQLAARVAELDVDLDKSILKAPFDGIVAQRQLDEGTVASLGQSVIRLIENVPPEAKIGMPTEVALELPLGSDRTLNIGSQAYRATVEAILPEVDLDTRTQIVKFNLDPSALARVNPGQTVRIELTKEINTDGYWLPVEALTQGIRGLWTCYLLSELPDSNNYIVKQHSVEIISQQDDLVLVRGTLQSGDRIVASGTHRLVPGQRVSLNIED
ncbi:MAG: efflux RND transporter periplasmic adaptor subunit [Cyanobacteria bacterium J06623_7]